MSHFTTYVIIPEAIPMADFDKFIANLLAPFDENIEVPEYDKECYCIGSLARTAAQAAASEKLGTMEVFRAAFYKTHPRPSYPGSDAMKEELAEYSAAEEALEDAWATAMRPRVEFIEQFEASHSEIKNADPKCGFDSLTGERYSDDSGCAGTGTYRSTCNPQSQWDWFVVGGRWDGLIQGEDFVGEKDHREFYDGLTSGVGTQYVNNTVNAGILKKLIHKTRDRVPFAMIDHEGKWHQKAEMGWFGVSSGETQADWPEEIIELLDAADEGDWVVALDLHI